MPFGFQKIYRREDPRRNSKWLYVFGDNVRRVGLGGQAHEMRHEPNAVGVATKYSPAECFGDDPVQVSAQQRIIDNDMKPLFEHVKNGGTVIWPADGIGTGLAMLPQYAPRTFDYLEEKLAALRQTAKLLDPVERTQTLAEALDLAIRALAQTCDTTVLLNGRAYSGGQLANHLQGILNGNGHS